MSVWRRKGVECKKKRGSLSLSRDFVLWSIDRLLALQRVFITTQWRRRVFQTDQIGQRWKESSKGTWFIWSMLWTRATSLGYVTALMTNFNKNIMDLKKWTNSVEWNFILVTIDILGPEMDSDPRWIIATDQIIWSILSFRHWADIP